MGLHPVDEIDWKVRRGGISSRHLLKVSTRHRVMSEKSREHGWVFFGKKNIFTLREDEQIKFDGRLMKNAFSTTIVMPVVLAHASVFSNCWHLHFKG